MKIVADANIAHLTDFFNETTLQQDIEIIALAGRDITADVLAEHQPEVLLVRSVTPINATLLQNNTSVKFIGSATIGIDHVDVDYLAKRGIIFSNAMGCSKHSVAQYVVSAILTLRPDYLFQPITLGIIGLGNTGSTLAQYAVAGGWQVLGYDPLKPPSVLNNSRLETVLRESNVISFHVPLTTPDTSSYPTHHDYLMTPDRWQLIPDTTIIINSSRGAVLGQDDILASKNVTVLDVFEHEPAIDQALLNAVSIVTPHVAGYTLEGRLRGSQMIYEVLCRYLGVKPTVDFHAFLPPEMPLFTEKFHIPLNDHERQQLLNKLPVMYDIRADDRRLRAVATADGVAGKDFDNLRKNYPLRREWHAYGYTI